MPPKSSKNAEAPTAPGVEIIDFEDPDQAKFGCLVLNRFAKTIEHNFHLGQNDWAKWHEYTYSKSPLPDEVRDELIMDLTLSVMLAHPDCGMGYDAIQDEILNLINVKFHMMFDSKIEEDDYAMDSYSWTGLDLQVIALGIYLHSPGFPPPTHVDSIKNFALLDVIGEAMSRTRRPIGNAIFACYDVIHYHYKRFSTTVRKHGLGYLLDEVDPTLTPVADYWIMDITERLESAPNPTPISPPIIPINQHVIHEPTYLPIIPRLRIPLSTTRRSATAKQLAVAQFRPC